MPQVYGWSDDDFEDRANDLAALIRRVWRAIARLIAAQAEKQNTVTMAVAQPIPTQWQQALDGEIIGFVRNVYLDAAGGISDAVNAPDELLIGDNLVEVYTNAARNRLIGIGDDVWHNVQAQITLGNQLGEGIPEIAARIRNVAGVSEARSLTIARTEVHAAFESGSYEQAMFVDPDGEKVWLATEDERTRPSHRAADGQRVKIGEAFDIGGEKLRFPGDPLGAAGNCINCRCSVAYDFDMITTVVEEPEPAMTAAGGQVWKPHMHPRGADGKFIEKGAVSDFLKKAKPNIIDVQNAVSGMTADQWKKLTPAQKNHIEASVDKLPKGTKTHSTTKSALDKIKEHADTPKLETTGKPVELPGITPTKPAKIPAGLKGKPGDPAKITTGVIWGKHPAGTVIVEHNGGLERVMFDGKKFQHQTKSPFGGWGNYKTYSKKEAYEKLKGDDSWLIPGKKNDVKHSGDVPSTLGHDKSEKTDVWGDITGIPSTSSEPPQTPSTPEPTDTTAPDWTKSQDFSGFSKIGGQAGSNPGGKYKAPNGDEWYIKKPKSAKHAANEQAAAAFYNLAGVDAPQVMVGGGAPELGDKFQTGTKIVSGAKANLGSKLNDKAYIKEIRSGFAMDAWLANWDVAGMGYDNIVEGADGKPHRIDVGGALLFRAQGTPKGDKFGNTVDELNTLRDAGLNPTSAKIFGSMTDDEIRKSAAKVEAISEEQIDKIVADAGLNQSVAETLKARRKDILAKYPPLKDDSSAAPSSLENAKDKLNKQWEKGLLTHDEYVDLTGEEPPNSYGGVHDKGVLLNDLESGAILPMDQAIDLASMLDKSDYDDLQGHEKAQLETTLSTAANMNKPGGKEAYAHWQSLNDAPTPDAPAATILPMAGGPLIDGSSLGLKDLHNLVVNGKHFGKYSDGQIIGVSPNGDQQLAWRADMDGYVVRDTDTGNESYIQNIHAIKKIRDEGFHIPESLLPNHGGTLVNKPTPDEPSPNDPVVDTDTIGTTNSGALFALDNGDAEKMITIDGKYELYKSADGKWTALKENHPSGTNSITLVSGPDDLEHETGLQVWYPKQEIDQSVNAPDATAGVSAKKIDLSNLQEEIDLGEYVSGETIGITQDGQQKLVYSAFLGGVQLKHKVGNTGDDDMDWDTEASYSDDTGSPVADFLDDYPGIKLFEPQPDSPGAHWPTLLQDVEDHGFNDIVAETTDGKFKLVKKSWGTSGPFAMYEKNANGKYQKTGQQDDASGIDLLLPEGSGDSNWITTVPGHSIPAAQLQALAKKTAKKAPAKKMAGVPQSYSAASVSHSEKTFYLEDAAASALVPSEAVHLLNGEGGLNLDDVKTLTGTQTANINKQLEKALDSNIPGSGAAWQKWADFENQLNSGNGLNTADESYFLDMEDEMYGGNKSTGDVIAVTPDGKYRIVVHSTEGPGMNPDSFAMELNGPYGWETHKIYGSYSGNPGAKLINDHQTMEMSWVIPDADTSSTPSAPNTPNTPAGPTFDPPGNGAQQAGTIFDMLDWVPEDKALLVGKDGDGGKWVMTAGKNADGEKVIKIASWHPIDNQFKPNAELANEHEYELWDDAGVKWDTPGSLPDKSALDDFMGNPNSPAALSTPNTLSVTPTAPSAVSTMPALTSDNIDAIWSHIQTLEPGTPIGTAKNIGGEDIRAVVQLHTPVALGEKTIEIQKKDVNGNWVSSHTLTKETFGWDLEDYAPWTLVKSTPSTSSAPSASSTPSAVTPSGPPAPNHIPFFKLNALKTNMKAGGNVGYWSKPEKIWEHIKNFQAKPGNDQYSPMDIFLALDKTLKTDKHSYADKMKKWAATKKGAQIIGADGIFGPAPTAAPAGGGTPEFKPANLDAIWAKVQTMKAGDILAINEAGNKRLKVVTDTPGQMSYIYESKSSFNDTWSYYAGGSKNSLQGLLNTEENGSTWQKEGWKPVTPAATTPAATPSAKKTPKIPDIESGNDISGVSEAKQQAVYTKFKAEPFTYLKSPEHSIFDALDSVAKSEGLTLAQVLNIVDEVGAKKVSAPNTGLFKQKITAWLKTPEAAAHISNEPTAVKGLPTPPAFSPKYDPYLNPGQIPSFEESNKLKYNWVANNSAATTMWNSMISKTEDITPSQKKGLTTWSGGAYTTINGYLFKPNQPKLSGTHQHSLTHSQQGMRPVDRPVLLVRGTGFDGLGNAKNHQQLEKLVGTTWRNNAYAATSVGADHNGIHAPAFASFPLWVEFECPPGTPMAWLAPFSASGQSEREMLLAANLHYKIISVEKKMIPGYGMKSIARVRIVPKPEGAADE